MNNWLFHFSISYYTANDKCTRRIILQTNKFSSSCTSLPETYFCAYYWISVFIIEFQETILTLKMFYKPLSNKIYSLHNIYIHISYALTINLSFILYIFIWPVREWFSQWMSQKFAIVTCFFPFSSLAENFSLLTTMPIFSAYITDCCVSSDY